MDRPSTLTACASWSMSPRPGAHGDMTGGPTGMALSPVRAGVGSLQHGLHVPLPRRVSPLVQVSSNSRGSGTSQHTAGASPVSKAVPRSRAGLLPGQAGGGCGLLPGLAAASPGHIWGPGGPAPSPASAAAPRPVSTAGPRPVSVSAHRPGLSVSSLPVSEQPTDLCRTRVLPASNYTQMLPVR